MADRTRRLVLGVFAAMVSVGLVIGLALGVVVAKRRGGAEQPSRSAAPPPSAAPPASPAASVFAEAMSAQRAADPVAMHTALERAVRLDPSFGPAHLQLGLSALTGGAAAARSPLDAAARHEGSLSARERALLHAVQPCVGSQAADLTPCLGTLRALLAGELATDPFAHALVGWLLLRVGEPGEGLTVATRGIELDPRFAFGWLTRGALEAFLGRYDDALSSFEACAKQSPGATACLRAKVYLHSHLGERDACERTARLLVDRSPSDPVAAQILADALAANHRPEAEVEAAVARAVELAPDDAKPALRARLEGALAARRGDLTTAAAKYEVALGASVSGAGVDPRRSRHTLLPLLELLHELDKDAYAVQLADGLEAEAKDDGAALEAEPYAPLLQTTPMLVAARHRGKAIDSAERRRALETFEASGTASASRALAPFLWLATWGATADTKSDAEDAFGRLRTGHLSLPTYAPGLPRLSGRALRLAGRLDEAIADLEPASRSCLALSAPLADVQASYELGLALEAKKDKRAACDAFRVVVEAWGQMRKPPLTARRARKRLAALGCKRG
jgi:tetratricopeptide (TPR) repeat protein